MFKKYIPYLLPLILFFILYYPVIGTYFTQDDFFHFKLFLTDGSIKELLSMAGFHPFEERDIAFYRPLYRDFLYHFSYRFFGLNQFPLRILSLILHFGNSYLTYKLINKLFKDKLHAYITSLFYLITASNVATLYYLAGGIQTLGVLFIMLSCLLMFLKYLENNKLLRPPLRFRRSFPLEKFVAFAPACAGRSSLRFGTSNVPSLQMGFSRNCNKVKYLFFTFIFFILALMSHEQSYILPFLLLVLYIISNKKQFQPKSLLMLIPFFLVFLVYMYMELNVIGYSKNEVQYQAVFSLKKTLNTYYWYSIWALGIPEMLQDFMPSIIRLDPRLMRHWGEYFRIILPCFVSALGMLLIFLVSLLKKNIRYFADKRLLFLIIWYIFGLFPLALLPSHKSGHYLTPVLPAFWGIIGYLIVKFSQLYNSKYSKAAVYILIIFLIILSSTSAMLGKNNYWAAQRGNISNKIMTEFKMQYPTLPQGAVVYIQNDPNQPFVSQDWGSSSKQAFFVLNGSDAIQLLYKDPSIKVIYEDFVTDKIIVDESAFPFVAKIY